MARLNVGDYGPISTQLGSLTPEALGRQLLSEFLDGGETAGHVDGPTSPYGELGR